MKIQLNKILVIFFLAFAVNQSSFAQLTVPNYTACPCQIITASATWNNVSSITYSLYAPPGTVTGPPLITWSGASAGNTFTISNCSNVAANIAYTLVASGLALNTPVTNTATFVLSIFPPSSLVLSQPNNGYYCNGTNATITAPIGGATYTYAGSVGTGTSASNIIAIPGALGPSTAGTVTITSVIAGCTVTGVTNIFVSPVLAMAITGVTNVCEGACVTLTSNVPGGSNYQWNDNFGAPIPGSAGGTVPTYQKCGLTINDGGVYSVGATTSFNGQITCPYTASTTVNVVQTNAVNITPSPAAILCQGAQLTLNGLLSGNATPLSWSWSGPGFSSNIANPSISPALPVNSGVYTATAVFSNGFLNCPMQNTVNITIVPVSVPVITMPSSVCQDYSVAYSGSAGPGATFSWSGPLFTGNVSTTAPSSVVYSVQPGASGTQFLTVTYASGATQCQATSSVQLNVVPVNTVSVIPPTQVCAPANAFLQALATGANQYLWQGPNYTSPGANVWVYNTSPASSGIYTVTAYFNGGTNLVCSNTNTLQLVVNPVLYFSLIPRQQVCFNTAVTITGPVGATSYSWTSSTGFTSNNKDIVINPTKPGNSGTYTLNVSLGPCVTTGVSELVVLTPVEFTLTPFDRTICRGDTIYLEGAATGGSGNYAYNWNPSVFLESPTGPKQMAIPLGSTDYNLTVYDIACPNFTVPLLHPVKIKVNQPPIPDLHLASDYGCAPFCLDFKNISAKQSFVTTYDFGGKYIFQSQDTLFKCGTAACYSLTEPGTYYLKVTSKGLAINGGCTGTYDYPAPIVVNAKPGTDVYWNPETPTTNDEITFYPTYKSENVTYTNWNFLGGATLGDTTMHNSPGVSDTSDIRNPKRTYSQFGTYPVVLISENDQGCRDTVYKFVKVIDELQLFIPNSFTPNDDGINDVFMPKGTGMKVENYSMDIFNRAGLNIFTTKDINVGWDGKVRGQVVKDATYIYKIKVVGMNGEGRKEYTGYFTIIK